MNAHHNARRTYSVGSREATIRRRAWVVGPLVLLMGLVATLALATANTRNRMLPLHRDAPPFHIFQVVPGSRTIQEVVGVGNDAQPRWSPDAQRLAFSSAGADHFEIYVAGADGSNVHAVAPGDGMSLDPAWSRDGSHIALSSNRTGNFDIYVANLEANGAEALKRVSSDTELAPALAAGHPTQVPLPQAAGAPGNAVVAPVSAAPSAAASGILPDGISPYVLALVGLAVAWVVVEAVIITRRRPERRTVQSDGE